MLNTLLTPIAAIKQRHLSILVIYLMAGFAAFDAVTSTFYIKNHVSLSADKLIELSIWISLPWSIKILFGSIIDNFRLFGNNRKNYIYLGAVLMILGEIVNMMFVYKHPIRDFLGEYAMLLISGLLVTLGVVVADIVADTLAVEVAESKEEISMLQVLSRLSQTVGALFAAITTGYLAANYSPEQVYALKFILPAVIIFATILSPSTKTIRTEDRKNYKDLAIAAGFGLFCVTVQSQLAVFIAQMIVVNYMLFRLSKEMGEKQKYFLIACAALFLFRVAPDIGPGYSWWLIDGLKFDEIFMGHLRIISAVASISVLWLLTNSLVKNPIEKSMTWIIVAMTVVSIPPIAVFYGLHEFLGLSARTIFLIDTGAGAPLAGLTMIPLGILIAQNAPERSKAMYMSLTASFMNMALVGGDLMTRGLNKVFIVTRSDFSQLGMLMIWSLIIGTVLSIIGLVLIRKK